MGNNAIGHFCSLCHLQNHLLMMSSAMGIKMNFMTYHPKVSVFLNWLPKSLQVFVLADVPEVKTPPPPVIKKVGLIVVLVALCVTAAMLHLLIACPSSPVWRQTFAWRATATKSNASMQAQFKGSTSKTSSSQAAAVIKQ